jgi:hypothetical protein
MELHILSTTSSVYPAILLGFLTLSPLYSNLTYLTSRLTPIPSRHSLPAAREAGPMQRDPLVESLPTD